MSVENIDPIRGTELMSLLGVEYYDLDSPKKFQMFSDISDYFQGNRDMRFQVLKVISSKPFANKLDMVWGYVQLAKERRDKIRSLNPEHFTEDIQKEIKNEYLGRDSIKFLKEQARQREQKITDLLRTQVKEKREEQFRERKESASNEKALSESESRNAREQLVSDQIVFQEVEDINNLMRREGYE